MYNRRNEREEGGCAMSILIADTTREEREKIVEDSVGNISALCDGCSAGILDMYQAYIDGKKELREVNMEFRANFISGEEGPERSSGCECNI